MAIPFTAASVLRKRNWVYGSGTKTQAARDTIIRRKGNVTLIDKKEFKAQEKSLTKGKGKKWDGRSRPPNKTYKENYDAIFKKDKREVE